MQRSAIRLCEWGAKQEGFPGQTVWCCFLFVCFFAQSLKALGKFLVQFSEAGVGRKPRSEWSLQKVGIVLY